MAESKHRRRKLVGGSQIRICPTAPKYLFVGGVKSKRGNGRDARRELILLRMEKEAVRTVTGMTVGIHLLPDCL